jgi:hypothetical protein
LETVVVGILLAERSLTVFIALEVGAVGGVFGIVSAISELLE